MARILIIDDNDDFRDMLKTMIERDGHEAVSASDGGEGMALYRKEPADLVITDIIMPNKEGIETIFEFYKEFPDTKIIAISGGGGGSAEDYLKMASLAPNVECTFQKPFATKDLLQAVKGILDK